MGFETTPPAFEPESHKRLGNSNEEIIPVRPETAPADNPQGEELEPRSRDKEAKQEASSGGISASNSRLEHSLSADDLVLSEQKNIPSVPMNPMTNPEWKQWSQEKQMVEWERYREKKEKFEAGNREQEKKAA